MSEFSSIWRWLLGDVIDRTPPRQLVLVAGSAAGVGASTATAVLARAAAASGREVLLVDTGASLTGLLSTAARKTAGPADAGESPMLTVVQEGITLVSTTVAPRRAAPHSEQRAGVAQSARLARIASLIPRYDVAIVDAGSRMALLRELLNAFSARRRGSDQLVVVTRTEPMHCASAYAMLKSVASRPLSPRLHLLVNATDADAGATAYGRIESASRRFCRRSVVYAGALPDDTTLRAGSPRVFAESAFGTLSLDADAADLLKRLLRPLPTHLDAPAPRRLLSAET